MVLSGTICWPAYSSKGFNVKLSVNVDRFPNFSGVFSVVVRYITLNMENIANNSRNQNIK